MKLEELREKYKTFVYKDYLWKVVGNNLEITFSFKTEPDIIFSPALKIKNLPSYFFDLDEKVIDNLVFHIGLVEIPSYWKATCSPIIKIKAGSLTKEQTQWWHDMIVNGMGQFFYENKVDFTDEAFLKIESESNNVGSTAVVKRDRTLIPVGGGKDSSVSLELLGKNAGDVGAFVVNPTRASLDTIGISGVKDAVEVERIIDPKLLILNQKGYLNGHTPISSVFAFISVFCAYIFEYKNIAFSNERSSNEENVIYLGKKINHQYSKTYEFENKFREYNFKYLSDINYFSFLRPLYELQISKIFSKYSKYFPAIRSCNVGQKLGEIWCCQCPKCLSTFILLYPFLKEKILEVFPENLYENEGFFSLLEDLILEDHVKPFECVGTREELKVALYLSRVGQRDLPPLLNRIWKVLLYKEGNWEERANKILNGWGGSNLSKEFVDVLKAGL